MSGRPAYYTMLPPDRVRVGGWSVEDCGRHDWSGKEQTRWGCSSCARPLRLDLRLRVRAAQLVGLLAVRVVRRLCPPLPAGIGTEATDHAGRRVIALDLEEYHP